MDTTTRLALPLLASGQAQKHVTHNDALAALDTLVGLHLEAFAQNAPPAAAMLAEGLCWGIGTAPVDEWLGHAGQIAVREGGGWRFQQPVAGLVASVGADHGLHVFSGATWQPVAAGGTAAFERVGIGTAADANNALVVEGTDVLMTAEGPTGSLRLKLNKPVSAGTASLLLQNGYTGHAEIGLIGSDDLGVKVSPDGQSWTTALTVRRTDGMVSAPAGLAMRGAAADLLINGDFRITQRGAPTGVIPAGAFIADRWRAAPGGCDISRAGAVLILTAGAFQQIVEPEVIGVALPASAALRIMASGLSQGSLLVTVGSQSVTLTVSAPEATLVLAQQAGAQLLVKVAATGGAAHFSRISLHRQDGAAGLAIRPPHEAQVLCQRYFYKTLPPLVAPGTAAGGAPGAVSTSLGLYYAHVPLPVPMVRQPVARVYDAQTGAADSWRTGGGTLLSPTLSATPAGAAIYGAGAEAGTLVYGHLVLDAEPQQPAS